MRKLAAIGFLALGFGVVAACGSNSGSSGTSGVTPAPTTTSTTGGGTDASANPCNTNADCGPGRICEGKVCKTDPAADGGSGSDGGTGSDGSISLDASPDANCLGKPIYRGMYNGMNAKWTFAGTTNGIASGVDACKSLVPAGDHPCDYEEIKAAIAKGELADVPDGTTFWVHRSTPDPDNTNNGGPNLRCNEWKYNTNDICRGEFGTKAGGAFTFDLHKGALINGGLCGAGAGGGVTQKCGGVTRSVLCCNPKCI